MKSADALRVVIFSTNSGLSQTLRTGLRGVDIRDVMLTATPRAAMDTLGPDGPDLLLVDVEGPENDAGLSLIRFVRRWEKSPNRRIAIVAMSQRRDVQTVTAAINAGTNEYAVIPASADTLLKRIFAAVQSDRPFIEHASYVGPCRRRRQVEGFPGPERRAIAAIAAE